MARKTFITPDGRLEAAGDNDFLQKSRSGKKFLLWLIVVSSSIMFAGWTSYYIVFSGAKGKGHGLVLPDMFIYSSAVLVLSSVVLVLAKRAFGRGQYGNMQKLLAGTGALGIVFAVLQFMAWKQLISEGATFINNNAGISMIYVFTLFHVFHVLAGLGLLAHAYMGAARGKDHDTMEYRLSIASVFWHFLDILWIYLYVFLILNS